MIIKKGLRAGRVLCLIACVCALLFALDLFDSGRLSRAQGTSTGTGTAAGTETAAGTTTTNQQTTNQQTTNQQATNQQATNRQATSTEPSVVVAGKFNGVNDGEGIKLTSNTTDFRHSLQVMSTGKEVKDMRIVVDPLTGPDSAQVVTTWTVGGQPGDKPFTLAAFQAVPLEVSAQLPLTGAYRAFISLIYDNKRWPIPLTVTRARPGPSVEVSNVETATDVSFLPWGDAALRLTLREKDGKRVSLNKPTLLSLSLVESDKRKIQAKYDQIVILDTSGEALPDRIELGPREVKHLKLVVKGLEGPGEFSGNLAIDAPDSDLLNQPITILRKKSGVIAGFLIFIGVLISFGLRYYSTTARPRLIRQRRVLALTSDVDEIEREAGDLSEAEREVLQGFRRRLTALYEEIAMATDKQSDETLEEINKKLGIFPAWVQERRRVETLQSAALQKEFRDELDKVKAFMVKSPVTSDEVDAEVKRLAAIGPNMQKKVKEDFEKRLTAFEAEVNAQRQATTSDTLRNRLGAEVDPKIASAKEELKADAFEKARAAYDEARLTYARILLDDLTGRLTAGPPKGFEAADWQRLNEQLAPVIAQARLAKDADSATKLYQSAFTTYLRELSWKLQGAIDALRTKVSSSTTVSKEVKKAHEAALVAVKGKLDAVLQKVDSGQLREAAQEYETIRAELLNMELPAGVSMGAAGDAASASASAVAAGDVPDAFNLPFLGAATTRARGALPSFGELTSRLVRYDLLVTFFILIAAVFFGLKLLWAGVATWGGWNDYLTAILWGLGLHQVSNVAFQGISDVATRLMPGKS
jgi:hypothetical protein